MGWGNGENGRIGGPVKLARPACRPRSRSRAEPAEVGESRGGLANHYYFKTAIRVTAFLLNESLIYSTFTLSPMNGGLESTEVL